MYKFIHGDYYSVKNDVFAKALSQPQNREDAKQQLNMVYIIKCILLTAEKIKSESDCTLDNEVTVII